MGPEARPLRDGAGEMVVEVTYPRARIEHAHQRFTIDLERDVEHGDLVAAPGIHPRQQFDVALGAGDQDRLAWLGQAQLVQRAQTVRIAIENVIEFHR